MEKKKKRARRGENAILEIRLPILLKIGLHTVFLLLPQCNLAWMHLRTVIFKSPFRLRKQRGMVDGNSSYTQDANISI